MKRSSLSLSQYRWNAIWLPLWSTVLAIVAAVVILQLPLAYAAALILISALFIATILQPLVGLGVALIVGPLGAYENIVLGNLPVESGQLLFFAAVAGWLVKGVLDQRIFIHRTAINLPLAVFIAVAALTLLDAFSLALGIKELVKWLELAIAMLMVVDLTLVKSEYEYSDGNKIEKFAADAGKTRLVLAILLIAGVTQAAIGIWQFGIRGTGPDHFVILERFYRAFGTFMQPNPFGGFMAVTASLAIGTLAGLVMEFAAKWRNGSRFKLSWWLWFAFITICAALSSMALLMSWSRGAWLGFAAAIVVFLFFLPKRHWKGFLLIVMIAVLFVAAIQLNIMPQSISSRFGSFGSDLQIGDVRGELVTIDNYAVVERLAHWQAGLNMARANLATGVGFGNYERAYPDYSLVNWPFALGHAHNYYINLLAEVGIVGALAYVALWAAIFIQAIRILRRGTWPVRGIALGLLAAWVVITVHHAVDKLYVNNMFIYFGVMLGLQQVLDYSND